MNTVHPTNEPDEKGTTMAEWEIKRNERSIELRAAKVRLRSERLKMGSLVLVVVLLVAAALSTGHAVADQPMSTVSVKVEPGDSLWSIAAKHAPAHIPTYDAVQRIALANDLDGSTIHPGQLLEVPAGIR